MRFINVYMSSNILESRLFCPAYRAMSIEENPYNNDFYQVPHGDTEKSISVRARILSEICSAEDFLMTSRIPDREQFYYIMKVMLSRYYNINNFNPGLIDELIKNAYAFEACAELKSTRYGLYFDEMDSIKLEDIYTTRVRKRLRSIKKYAKMGPPFPEPLYLQEKLLEDILGYEVDPHNMVMVDGARRILAGCLCRLREMKIILIAGKGLKN